VERPRSPKGPPAFPAKPTPKRPPSSHEVAPAPPRGAKRDDLAEVERALSVLGGHHPDHERAQREVQEALSRKREMDAVAAHAHGEVRSKRAAVVAVIAVASLIVVGVGAWRYLHGAAVERALEGPTARFAARGFGPVASGEAQLDEQVEPGCFVAVTPEEGDGKLEIEHGGETLSAERSIGWCACTPEHVAVRSTTPLRLLRADGRAVGNVAGLGAVDPRPRVVSTRAEDCAAEQLDAWLAEKGPVPAPVDVAAFEANAALTPLRTSGFAPIAALPAGRAFSVVDGGAASCFLAFGRAFQGTLSLRLRGGARPVTAATGAMGWCSEQPRLVTLWREGDDGNADIVIAAAPAARVAGMLGLRERAARAGLPALTAWIAPEELAWDAVEVLHGTAIADATAVLSGSDAESRPAGDARVAALSLAPGGSFAPDRRGEIAFACAPKIDSRTLETVCAQGAAQQWRQTGALGAIGVAQAPYPFWLSVFAPVKDPELPKALISLLTLARRLRGDGFEPTTLAGVLEEPSGVSVVGRGGDDAIVAVGLGPRAPYVWPYSDGSDWRVDGEPRVVALAPGERVVLSSSVPPSVAKDERRTVVFRRPARPPASK
jgi:hypothetical protein